MTAVTKRESARNAAAVLAMLRGRITLAECREIIAGQRELALSEAA